MVIHEIECPYGDQVSLNNKDRLPLFANINIIKLNVNLLQNNVVHDNCEN